MRTAKSIPTLPESLYPHLSAGHRFFAPAAERTPFVPLGASGACNEPTRLWLNAWWLAEMSLLVYRDRSEVATALAGTGFSLEAACLQGIGLPCWFAVSNQDVIIVSFRGTELAQFLGLDAAGIVASLARSLISTGTALLYPMTAFGGDARNGHVHAGFAQAFDQVAGSVRTAVVALQADKPREVWYTGHSQGGALATLAAARFADATAVVTFGCPRAGDDTFVSGFPPAARVWRFCTPDDPIARLPARVWPWDYRHVGPATLLDETLEPALRSDAGEAPTSPDLRRHAPLLYGALIWNYLAKRGV